MKKRKQKTPQIKKEEQYDTKIANQLNDNILKQLQHKKHELKQAEERHIKAQEEEKRKERERIEKNKSFEELLNDSNLDWKSYK